jgi:transmembrane sensor
MLGKADQILLLLRKYVSGEISDSEKVILDECVRGSQAGQKLYNELSDPELFDREFKIYLENVGRATDGDLKNLFESSIREAKVMPLGSKNRNRYKWLIAASIIFIVAAGTYFTVFNKSENGQIVKKQPIVKDVLPGTFKAKLTLDDGRTIILDNASKGEITKQGNAVVLNQNGQLVYSSSPNATTTKILHNTLSTGRGEMYPTVLSDGSKVWLNNETTIHYPVTFTSDERRIELEGGEAYFEVMHNSDKPFKVIVNGTEVEVLGTQFSISAFADEDFIQTNLLTGKVKVTHGSNPKILTPGQKANVDKTGNINLVKDADVEGSIAWVRGFFHFEEADMHSVMRQLARWYDVEVVFEGQIPNEKIKGDIQRNIPLSKVLSNLERIGKVNLRMEGRKIIVNP